MTIDEKKRVVEILETAHGLALSGSIVAFRLACIELGAMGTAEALLAGAAVDAAKTPAGVDGKPNLKLYPFIFEKALDLVGREESDPGAASDVSPGS